MNTISGKCVEEDRERSHKGLTFTRCHLCNLTLMQYSTTEELDIIMDHVPKRLIATGYPMIMVDSLVAFNIHKIVAGRQFTVKVCSRDLNILVVGEALSHGFHDGEGHRTDLIEYFLIFLKDLLLQLVNFFEDRLTVLNISLLDFSFQFINLCAQGLASFPNLFF